MFLNSLGCISTPLTSTVYRQFKNADFHTTVQLVQSVPDTKVGKADSLNSLKTKEDKAGEISILFMNFKYNFIGEVERPIPSF